MTLWLVSRQQVSYPEAASTTTPNALTAPSTSFSDIEIIVNSPKGTPQYKLSAPTYRLYPEQRRAEFELPNITVYPDNGGKISVTSLQGQTHDDNDRITLVGNVRINQLAAEDDPHRHWFEITTDKMMLDLNTQVLYLYGNVEGHYEP